MMSKKITFTTWRGGMPRTIIFTRDSERGQELCILVTGEEPGELYVPLEPMQARRLVAELSSWLWTLDQRSAEPMPP